MPREQNEEGSQHSTALCKKKGMRQLPTKQQQRGSFQPPYLPGHHWQCQRATSHRQSRHQCKQCVRQGRLWPVHGPYPCCICSACAPAGGSAEPLLAAFPCWQSVLLPCAACTQDKKGQQNCMRQLSLYVRLARHKRCTLSSARWRKLKIQNPGTEPKLMKPCSIWCDFNSATADAATVHQGLHSFPGPDSRSRQCPMLCKRTLAQDHNTQAMPQLKVWQVN
jgi:hypothetical protein